MVLNVYRRILNSILNLNKTVNSRIKWITAVATFSSAFFMHHYNFLFSSDHHYKVMKLM